MPVSAYVLITVEPGKEHEIFDTLAKIPEVEGLRIVFGEYDLIARITVQDYRQAKDVVVNKIRRARGIRSTSTLLEA